jgi:hypothetical protein
MGERMSSFVNLRMCSWRLLSFTELVGTPVTPPQPPPARAGGNHGIPPLRSEASPLPWRERGQGGGVSTNYEILNGYSSTLHNNE